MGVPAPIGYATLHFHGGDVQLDLCDLAIVDPHNIKWTIIKKGNIRYATAKLIRDGKLKNVYMHRLLLGFPKGVVDHIDRNGLNNRRNNFRNVTAYENCANSAPRARGKSKYKGVSPYGKKGKWRATIQANGQWRQLGTFETEEDAARAYDKAAAALFGQTAWLNQRDYPL